MTTLERYDALITSGAMNGVTLLELRVLLVYLKHADARGIAWPGSERIGELLGQSDGAHARAARKKLIDKGYLVELPKTKRADGRVIAPYRVILPSCQSRTSAESALPEKQPKIDAPHSADPALVPNPHMCRSGLSPSADLAISLVPNRHIEVPIEQPIEQPIENDDECDGMTVGGGSGANMYADALNVAPINVNPRMAARIDAMAALHGRDAVLAALQTAAESIPPADQRAKKVRVVDPRRVIPYAETILASQSAEAAAAGTIREERRAAARRAAGLEVPANA